MLPNDIGFIVAAVLAILAAFILYRILEPSLQKLLTETLDLPGGPAFYLRSLAILLFLGALGQAISAGMDLKPGARGMEYVWAIASKLSDVFGYLFAALIVYLVLITILIAALKPRSSK